MNYQRKGIRVLGSFIDSLKYENCIRQIIKWALISESRTVCICNVHVVVTANSNFALQSAINNCDMATADGMPIAWTLRSNGFPSTDRISGPDLMQDLLSTLCSHKLPVFFYGSTPKTLDSLIRRVAHRYPGLPVAGYYSPPFRSLTSTEDAHVIEMLNSSGARIIFIGLGCPKQELWMAEHKGKVNAVTIGVGAAFDFHAGNIKRAPKLLQRLGMEWLYRLYQEPGRLFYRYMTTNGIFIKYVLQKKIVDS